MHQGDVGDAFYIITSGEVHVQREEEVVLPGGSVSHTSRTLANLMTGDFFGEQALLTTGGRRAASCIARGPTNCLVLGREEFSHIMEDGLFTKDAWLWDDDDEVLSIGNFMHKFKTSVESAMEAVSSNPRTADGSLDRPFFDDSKDDGLSSPGSEGNGLHHFLRDVSVGPLPLRAKGELVLHLPGLQDVFKAPGVS